MVGTNNRVQNDYQTLCADATKTGAMQTEEQRAHTHTHTLLIVSTYATWFDLNFFIRI